MEQSQQTPSQQPPQPSQQPAKKGLPAWAWILGGCLMVCIFFMIAVVAIGWWGAKKIKNEYDKQVPGMQKMIEDAQREQQEWEEMSNELQKGIADMEQTMPAMPQ